MAKKKDSNFTDEEMAELGIIDNQIGFDELEKPKRKTRTKSSIVEDKIEEIQEDEVEEIEDSESEDEESTIKPKGRVTRKKQDPSFTSLLGEGGAGDGIVTKSVEQVIHESMMPYSEYVILDRALPRVEDGLKPVQRRVLYSMLEVGVTPDKPYRKSATIVGTCMGRYHPHGDSSIYQTMVRLAQDFNMGMCLVDGHGNFGSVDGDGAAAMRYTEARLSPISLELLKDIEKNTVSWSFNFDDSRKEPDMLPGRFPNLLVNGATGIAVGLATNIPTHNLGETIDCVTAYIDNPKIKLEELLKIMPGPDFSTGGYILSTSEFDDVYRTGKGKIVLRAKLHIETGDNGRKNIVITEIPFQVNKSQMLQRIAKLKEMDPTCCLSQVADIVDESDRSGTRAVIKLKKDANVKAIINYLYAKSDLQTNFNCNMVAIAEGKPKQLGLVEIISYYVKYQRSVVYNRTKFDLDAAEKRKHILDGLLIAIKNIDDVIKIIKTSKSTSEAKQRLMEKFYLSDVQAQAILDMRLARLTSLEVNKLINELEGLIKLIAELKAILESEKKLMNVVKKELNEIKKNYAIPRQTEIVSPEEDSATLSDDLAEEMPSEEVHVVLSEANTLKVVTKRSYGLATKGLSANPTLFETCKANVVLPSNKNIYLFTNLGNCHKVKVEQIGMCKLKDKGTPVANLVKNFEPSEKVIAMFDFNDNDIEAELIFVTKKGLMKITKQNEYISSKQSIAAIKLKDNDELVYVDYDNREKSLLMFSKEGMAVNAIKDDVTPLGRVSAGVKGMALSGSDEVVSATLGGAIAYTIFTSNGFAKVIKETEIPLTGRARKGIKVINAKKLDIKLLLATDLNKNKNYVVVTKENKMYYVESKKLSLENRLGFGKSVVAEKTGAETTQVIPYVDNEN
ncbi:MAG: DNA topoisomerase 4 subunit A [Clostridia bacterium]|nr:DNA topoisomerase 4 subunit A [Clostridia bacterium]